MVPRSISILVSGVAMSAAYVLLLRQEEERSCSSLKEFTPVDLVVAQSNLTAILRVRS